MRFISLLAFTYCLFSLACSAPAGDTNDDAMSEAAADTNMAAPAPLEQGETAPPPFNPIPEPLPVDMSAPVDSPPIEPLEPIEPIPEPGCIPNAAGTQVDQGDGTFFDEVTCLMWTSATHPKGAAGSGKEHVASCPSSAVGGYDDWRGPDAAEMASLIVQDENCGKWNQDGNWLSIVNSSALSGEKIFWTVTEGDSDIKACAVNGNDSSLKGGARDNPYYVLCVRGESTLTGSIATCTGDPCSF